MGQIIVAISGGFVVHLSKYFLTIYLIVLTVASANAGDQKIQYVEKNSEIILDLGAGYSHRNVWPRSCNWYEHEYNLVRKPDEDWGAIKQDPDLKHEYVLFQDASRRHCYKEFPEKSDREVTSKRFAFSANSEIGLVQFSFGKRTFDPKYREKKPSAQSYKIITVSVFVCDELDAVAKKCK